ANWHPFISLNTGNSLYELWAPIQERGGQSRSEWAFGHSIALGGALALAVPFAVSSKWHSGWKVASLTLLGVATMLTFSRSALAAFGIALTLSILFLASTTWKQKLIFLAASALGAALGLPWMLRVFDEAGSEAINSATYRDGLLSLIRHMQPLG